MLLRFYIHSIKYIVGSRNPMCNIPKVQCRNYYQGVPFLEFYKKTTGESISEDYYKTLKKRHPHIDEITHDRLQCTLQILHKFGISAEEACQNLHVFSMNPITMDNYGEILRECGFLSISAKHIIKYHTIVKSRTIASLKKDGLLPQDFELEQVILDKFHQWPCSSKTLHSFNDAATSILTIRMNVLERYLHWKLSVNSEQFQKYCRNYLPLKHKPMTDIQEAINIAQNDIKFDKEGIKRNGFVIAADPLHTKLILENVGCLAGMDVREAVKIEPAILKNNYNSIIQIKDMLEEYRISEEAQRRCLKVYCMNPETVRERLDELRSLKEYQILSTNPRILLLVIHKKKMLNRLDKIQTAKKQCYSLNHLVSSNQVFNNYINSFGDKVCGRDIAILISSALVNLAPHYTGNRTALVNNILNQLRKHKYWLHVAMNVIDENIHFLKKYFDDQIIFNNCQILLYPVDEVKHYINNLLRMRGIRDKNKKFDDFTFNNLNFERLTDDQVLSVVLYEIEKKYHFSGDGIWTRQVGGKVDSQRN